MVPVPCGGFTRDAPPLPVPGSILRILKRIPPEKDGENRSARAGRWPGFRAIVAQIRLFN